MAALHFRFIGKVVDVSDNGKMGFIPRDSIRREDRGELGLTIERDVYVNLNSFRNPEINRNFRLYNGMEIAFLLGVSPREPGQLIAERCFYPIHHQ